MSPMRTTLIAALPCGALLLCGTASGAQRQLTATGTKLGVESPCASQVTIDPDGSLSGKATITATADDEQEVSQLEAASGDVARLSVAAKSCWRPAGALSFSPTLRIVIHVPPQWGIAISDNLSTDYAIGPVGGPLAIQASGSGDLQAARVTALALELSGSGNVAVAHADGGVNVESSGSGNVAIAEGSVLAMNLAVSGSGNFKFGAGRVGTLHVATSGSGDVRIGGTVASGAVEASGSADVHIAKVTGTLARDVSGTGSVRIGD